MIIPLGIAEQRKKATVVTWYLMGFTALCMLGQQAVLNTQGDAGYRDFINAFGWVWFDRPWGLITYQFLHGDLMHLAGNMLFLWVFGVAVEDRIGRWRFLALYILGGIAAALAQSLATNASGASSIPTIGASGSVAAITGAFLVLAPRAPMRILFFFFLIGVFAIPAWWFIIFAVAKDLFWLSVSSASNAWTGVAHAAHLGGYAFGFIAAMQLLKFNLARKDQYNLFSAQKQARRRRAFKLAVEEAERERAARKAANPEIDAKRTEVSSATRAGNHESAIAAYEQLIKLDPDAVLSKDIQLSVAQHLHAAGQHTLAASAFEAFLERSPNDRDANATALMLAIVQGRYANNKPAAHQALKRIKQSTLLESERSMYNDLANEFDYKPSD